MDSIKNGWFSEVNTLWPGQCMSLEVEEVLFQEKSQFQDVMVFKSKNYGNVLVLDGVIQYTERDGFSYNEMITHLPLNSHPNPKKVLLIGGSSGRVIREISKHPLVETIDHCEIDAKVIEVCEKYLPYTMGEFGSPKVNLHVGDGFEFVGQHKDTYDVIITDSSDPVGPASSLFGKSYYELMKEALKPDGLLCSQGECMWLHLKLIKEMREACMDIYPVVDYAYTSIPSFPSGQIGLLLCSRNPATNFRQPVREWSGEDLERLKLRYYNPDIHRASFVLPQFAKKQLNTLNNHFII